MIEYYHKSKNERVSVHAFQKGDEHITSNHPYIEKPNFRTMLNR